MLVQAKEVSVIAQFVCVKSLVLVTAQQRPVHAKISGRWPSSHALTCSMIVVSAVLRRSTREMLNAAPFVDMSMISRC
jgi:hypothetical protein